MSSRHSKRHAPFRMVGYIAIFVIFVALAAGLITVLDKLSDDDDNKTASSTPDSSISSSNLEPVITDNIAPEISGAENKTVYIGDTVTYRSGVTVTDNEDTAPVLSIDSSKVDLTKAGSYEVAYTATDAAGNKTEITVTVTVKHKNPNYVDEETIFAAADKKLESLIKDGMDTKQKVKAIYNWANGYIYYSGKSDKSDYMQEAYKVLKGGGTDCFGYFAVTKLMFERLEIPNIDVKKVKNYEGDSNHYWSLVSVDGGQNYYHFDATPRKGSGDYFFLVTDAELDAYSNAHNKCHNRDKSLYPATPEE